MPADPVVTLVRRDRPAGHGERSQAALDRAGNLWAVTGVYGNNAMLVIPTSGPDAGQARRFASRPSGCELTGPTFTPDETALFLAVQHPGGGGGIRTAASRGDGLLSGAMAGSNWPTPGQPGKPPRPAVVVISREGKSSAWQSVATGAIGQATPG